MARPTGSSPYDAADRALVIDMEILIVTGYAPDMPAAARMLEHKAQGSGHGDARRRRLREKYHRYIREHGQEALRTDALAALKAALPPQPTRTSLKAAVASMRPALDYMLQLQRSADHLQRLAKGGEEMEAYARELERLRRMTEYF